VRLAPDTLASDLHGIIEVQVNGIWGRVCLHNFDDKDAAVACRQFGYDGGVAYLHIMKNDKPVLLRDVQCLGQYFILFGDIHVFIKKLKICVLVHFLFEFTLYVI
jgi:hypothetical protein